MVDFNIIWNYFVEYFFVIIVAVGLLVYIVFKYIRDRRAKNKLMARKPLEVPKPSRKYAAPVRPPRYETPQRPQPMPQPKPEPKPEPDFRSSFQEGYKAPETESRDLIKDINHMSNNLNQESINLDNSMKREFEKLRAELKEVHNRRKYIKNYGQKLAEVYDKYGKREYQLTQMMANLEKMIQETERRVLPKEEPRQ